MIARKADGRDIHARGGPTLGRYKEGRWPWHALQIDTKAHKHFLRPAWKINYNFIL